jgi:hypothetical protein
MRIWKPWVNLAALLVTLACFPDGIAKAQSAASRAVAVGRGTTADPYMGGMAPAPPGYSYATQSAVAGSAATGGLSTTGVNGSMMDPLGFGYVYGPGMPMTGTQAGMSMLLMQQRMLGIGNGQISGSRPQAGPAAKTARTRAVATNALPGEAHTANMNVPGGQAARYFNRGVAAPTSRSQPYFRRQSRSFPQSSQ